MGYLVVDAQILKEIGIRIDQEKQIVEFLGRKAQFKREIEFLEQLVKYKTNDDGIYPHLIINYHNTYRYVDEEKDSTFRGCLPLKLYREGKQVVLRMAFTPKEKVDQEYLDFYTKLLEEEVKNVKRRK